MKRILIGMIKFYRKYLSGLKRYSTCKYYPTCSQYGLEAIEKYGAFKGGLLAVWRILRSAEAVYQYADEILDWKEIGRGPASGSFQTAGMLIVPCSMKTAAGICCGYSDNLILRAADVTIKEQRPLVLAARETPVSAIHLRNLAELARLPGVHIIPPMMTFYHQPKTIQEMVHHIAAKLLEPFGIEAEGYRRWTGI